MAHDEQIELLRQGAELWNAWRAEHPKPLINLSGGNFRGLDLSGADLSQADLGGTDLRGTILSGANLAGARLVGANLFKAMLDRADLTRANLFGVQFLHCAQLQAAYNWQSAYRDEDLACGAGIPVNSANNRSGHRD